MKQPTRIRPSFEELFATLKHIEANKGRITKWSINKNGDWKDDDIERITITVDIVERWNQTTP